MEEALLEIIEAVRSGVVGGEGADSSADAAWLDKLVRRHNRAAHDGTRQVAKRRLLPFYLHVKAEDPERWAAWKVSEATEAALVRLLQAKPRRTASGVATITVLTKPWPCSGACVFCPNDIRMPKSYLSRRPGHRGRGGGRVSRTMSGAQSPRGRAPRRKGSRRGKARL